MKNWIYLPIVASVLTGCAAMTTKQVNETFSDKGLPLTRNTTYGSAHTLFDANDSLTKWTAHQSQTNGQYNAVGGLNETSSATNLPATLNAMTGLINAIPK